MQYITGISRHQLRFSNLEETISPDNPVRFIDAFVSYTDLIKLGFTVNTIQIQGRPIFLKIYLYGYLNGIRSSHKLEKECLRNLERQWV